MRVRTVSLRGLGLLLAGLVAQPSLAAPAEQSLGSEERSAKSAAAAEASVAANSRFATLPRAGCFYARRKLWVEGEGWIVRRVPLCP